MGEVVKFKHKPENPENIEERLEKIKLTIHRINGILKELKRMSNDKDDRN